MLTYIGIKNNNICIHKCDTTYNLHFNSYLEPLKVPFYVCTYYLGTYNVENIKSNWSYAFFYIFLQKKDYILCISTLKLQRQNADEKKHENLLWSNYKNKHIPLCFYIFRSLLTPFIRYVLTSRVLSFVFNESIFLRALNHMRTL